MSHSFISPKLIIPIFIHVIVCSSMAGLIRYRSQTPRTPVVYKVSWAFFSPTQFPAYVFELRGAGSVLSGSPGTLLQGPLGLRDTDVLTL